MRSQRLEEVTVAAARFEDAAGGLKMSDEFAGQRQWRLDIIITDVIAVRLRTHGRASLVIGYLLLLIWRIQTQSSLTTNAHQ
jgi:hypothetical protein